MQVLPGSRVDAWAVELLAGLAGGGDRGERYARLVLALRACQVLRGTSDLVDDLRLLAREPSGAADDTDYYMVALHHYHQVTMCLHNRQMSNKLRHRCRKQSQNAESGIYAV